MVLCPKVYSLDDGFGSVVSKWIYTTVILKRKVILVVLAHSITSSGDAHSGLSHSIEWPEVDGVSAGRAAALGALCRIICSKKSKETITDSQLAQFYKVVYEALLEVLL